jgi:hypothetical protein
MEDIMIGWTFLGLLVHIYGIYILTTCFDLLKYERNDERTFNSRFMDGMIREWHDCSGVVVHVLFSTSGDFLMWRDELKLAWIM